MMKPILYNFLTSKQKNIFFHKQMAKGDFKPKNWITEQNEHHRAISGILLKLPFFKETSIKTAFPHLSFIISSQ